jgi:hypothetical protein
MLVVVGRSGRRFAQGKVIASMIFPRAGVRRGIS